MSAARPGSGLLSAASTAALIELLSAKPRGITAEQAIRDLVASTPAPWSRARATLAKLTAYGIVVDAPDGGLVLSAARPDDWHRCIADRVAGELSSVLSEGESWSCVRMDGSTGDLVLDTMTMPAMPDGLAMWIVDFGVARRPAVESRFWILAAERHHTFLGDIREGNASRPRRAQSLADLAAKQELQAEHGEAAERWVLDFERLRLRGHPLRDQIRRVSQDDVSAGYDILSFSSLTSLQHDLFIEVKSHGTAKVFHWSRNEIAVAREFGESYALYLVDRTCCEQRGYVPQVITGPTPEMFALPESGWRVEATSFEHIAVTR